ncbi:MAG TPA: lysylphosphatidylglycerol synthase transmembrane domain-containing protein [Planctomicrobium sp.]|nr:lysylphosphatidylglycerol synthase transmembrane domain-containing protein [Planctomicrobium sp.]
MSSIMITSHRRRRSSQTGLFVLRLVVTVLLLTWLLRQAVGEKILAVLMRSEPTWLVISLFCCAMVHLTSGATTWLLLRDHGYSIGPGVILANHLRGLFAAQFLPSAVLADVIRVQLITKSASHVSWTSFGSILTIQRLAGLCVAIVSVMTLFPWIRFQSEWWLPWILFIGSFLGVALYGAIFYLLERTRDSVVPEGSLRTDSRYGRMISLAVIGAILQQMGLVCVVFAASRSLQLNTDLFALAFVTPLSLLLAALPISINGLGVREFAYFSVLTHYGMTASESIALSFGVFLVGMFFGATGGIVWLILGSGWKPHAGALETAQKGTA